MCDNKEILKIFNYTTDEDCDTIRVMTYLTMARAGLRGLEFWNPATKKHGQAHMQARLGILRWLLKDQIVKLDIAMNGDKVESAFVSVDRAAVLEGRGRDSISKLLVHLQVHKATGDTKAATEFYTELTTPDEEWSGALRDYVLANKVCLTVCLHACD